MEESNKATVFTRETQTLKSIVWESYRIKRNVERKFHKPPPPPAAGSDKWNPEHLKCTLRGGKSCYSQPRADGVGPPLERFYF
jgi:hypothetical protein